MGFKKAAGPKIVISADEMKLDPSVPQLGQGAEDFEVVREDDVPILEPEIEKVAKYDDAVVALRIDVLKEGRELEEVFPGVPRDFEVNIRENERFHAVNEEAISCGAAKNAGRPSQSFCLPG